QAARIEGGEASEGRRRAVRKVLVEREGDGATGDVAERILRRHNSSGEEVGIIGLARRHGLRRAVGHPDLVVLVQVAVAGPAELRDCTGCGNAAYRRVERGV